MKHILYLLAVGALCSTASMATANCQTGDWYATGLQDGIDGRYANYIRDHRTRCQRLGVRVNQRDWQEGRLEGLRIYCTPENAYSLGQRGRGFAPVCRGNDREYVRAHDRGLEWHLLNEQFQEYRGLRARALRDVQKARTPAEKRRREDVRAQITREMLAIQEKLDALKF